jgi:hypothetical protein
VRQQRCHPPPQVSPEITPRALTTQPRAVGIKLFPRGLLPADRNGHLEAHRWRAVFASTPSSIWYVAHHAECPLGFGLLGKALQVIVPIGLISARSGPKSGVIEHGARIGAWTSMSGARRDRSFCSSVLRPFGGPSESLRRMRLWPMGVRDSIRKDTRVLHIYLGHGGRVFSPPISHVDGPGTSRLRPHIAVCEY